MWRGLVAVLAALSLASPSLARADGPALEPVDLELILAVDVSGSIDDEERQLQREGFAKAITNEHILKAIQSGPLRRVAVLYMEWSGFDRQRIAADWALIRDENDAKKFADTIIGVGQYRGQWTSISSVIDRSLKAFGENKYKGARQVIDISGDGVNNNGDTVLEARGRAIRAGVTINGLPIINGRIGFQEMQPLPNLDLYYRDCVIGGQGAFIVVARRFSDFARAIRRKMFLELSGWTPPINQVLAQVRPRADCLAGEKRTLRQLQELNRILNEDRKAY